MKFTNRFGLPQAVLRAATVRNDLYKSNADKSVTQLINPPQIDILRKVHFKDMEKDLSEEFFALFGSAIHKVLEWGSGDDITEERLYAQINGWVISGQIDLQKTPNGVSIIDYKFTSAYSLTKEPEGKLEWEQQLNLYAYLMWVNKQVRVTDISVCAIVRDWSRAQALTDLQYPQSIITMVPLRLWSIEDQEAFCKARVAKHQQAKFDYEIGEALPECEHEERWAAADKWSVTFEGNKKAKNFLSEDEAVRHGEADKKGRKFSVRHVSGKSVRCQGNYCQVSKWCAQYARMSKEEVEGDDEQGTE
jgi:hypothetical protein